MADYMPASLGMYPTICDSVSLTNLQLILSKVLLLATFQLNQGELQDQVINRYIIVYVCLMSPTIIIDLFYTIKCKRYMF